MANQNQKTKIRTLYILEMLYTGCFTKEAISLLLHGALKISRKWERAVRSGNEQ